MSLHPRTPGAFLPALAALVLLGACDDGSGSPSWDAIVETSYDWLDTTADSDAFADPPADTASDTPWDEGIDTSADTTPDEPEEPWFGCVQSCTSETDCCTTGSACGTYPNSWVCDGYCRGAGCTGDGECQAWASGLGLPGAAAYRCRGYVGGFASCVAGCTSAADCCPTGITCGSYPYRYECAAGGCLSDGCIDDAECRAYAAEFSLPRAVSYVCVSTTVDYRYCVASCATDEDCCTTGSCTAYPQHWHCRGGLCTVTCSDTAECVAYATSVSLARAEDYICNEF